MSIKSHTLSQYFSYIKFQLIIICIFFTIYFLSFQFKFLNPDALYLILKHQILNHGVVIVVLSSLIENTFGLNSYFPGAVVIITAMSMTNGNINYAIITFLCIFIPVVAANIFNFYLGKKFSSNKFRDNEVKNISLMLFVTLWHPYLASISSLKLGSNKVPFRNYITKFIPISLFWNLSWGFFAYFKGYLLTKNSDSFLILFFVYLTFWLISDTVKFIKKIQNIEKQ